MGWLGRTVDLATTIHGSDADNTAAMVTESLIHMTPGDRVLCDIVRSMWIHCVKPTLGDQDSLLAQLDGYC